MSESDFLRERYGLGPDDMFPLRPGEWSKVFGFRKGGVEYVARFSKYREDFDKDAHMARYSSAALPIPPIIEIGETADGYYAISKRMTGGYLDDLDADGMRRVLPSFWAALDAMRDIDLSAHTGCGGWNCVKNGTRSRFCSTPRKKKARSRRIGPPTDPPNWFCRLLSDRPKASGDVSDLLRLK